MIDHNYSFKDDDPVPPRMWVKLTGTKIGIPIDTDPTKSYRENVRMCLLAAEKEYRTKGGWKVGTKLSGGERLVGEITGSGGAWPMPSVFPRCSSMHPKRPGVQCTCSSDDHVGRHVNGRYHWE
jgi:hypothetical protein